MIEICLKFHLSLEELFVLQCLQNEELNVFKHYYRLVGIDDAKFQKLLRYAYIRKIDPDLSYVVNDSLNNLEITEKGKFVRIEGEIPKAKAEGVNQWIMDYRLLFKGVKPKSMGDPKACEDNMKWFLRSYPQYTKEDIIAAAKSHIEENRNKPIYTRRADYFIKKMDANKAITSDLLMYLDSGAHEYKEIKFLDEI